MNDFSSASNQSLECDLEWVFLAEIPISQWMLAVDSGEKSGIEGLFQKVLASGIPAECLEIMERRLAQFTRKTLALSQTKGAAQTGVIRLFCQKKAIAGRKPSCPPQPGDAGQAAPPPGLDPAAKTAPDAGWGYFLMKRGSRSGEDAMPSVDLYLYREGEADLSGESHSASCSRA